METIRWEPYVRIARFDHWFKNVFMLPGVALAVFDRPELWHQGLIGRLLLALLAVGLVASSNYVLNEIIDAPTDAAHPVKCRRPIPSGRVNIRYAYLEWIVLGGLGLLLSLPLGTRFLGCNAALWLMGLAYNIPPVRCKDKPYIDVLSESVNNPLRLLLGMYATGTTMLPPSSLVMAYWMLGAFFMAVKRFAEYRRINDSDTATLYRRSFAHYNEESLLVSSAYYAVAFGLFFGIFLIRYRMELILSVPFLAGFIAWYIHIGLQTDSPAQYPEHLYRQYGFMVYTGFCLLLIIALMFVDVSILHQIFVPSIHVQK